VIVLISLPDLDGGQALKMIRAITATPVLVATARHEEAEIIRLLNAEPTTSGQAVSGEHWRPASPPAAPDARRARRGAVRRGAERRPARREARLDGRRLELTRREFDLLAYLTGRPGEVVTRRELRTEVWHSPTGMDQTIDVHVSCCVRKLRRDGAQPRYLHTVRGVGVKLDPAPVTMVRARPR